MTKDTNVFELDLSQTSPAFESVSSEMKSLGEVRVIKIEKGNFRANITSQKGNMSFTIAGKDKPYVLGANTVVKLSLRADVPIRIVNDLKQEFITSKHYTLLQTAYKRQTAMLAETK